MRTHVRANTNLLTVLLTNEPHNGPVEERMIVD